MSSDSFHRYPFYSPRFWHGMRPAGWWALLREGGFQIHPTRLPMVFAISFATLVNSGLAAIQYLLYSRKLAKAELHTPPVFIIGHWRSGTTLLHELLVLDARLSSPSTFQCFAPHHFLISEWFFRIFCRWLLPSHRPMDNMAAGWDRPQEDEFAIVNLGLPSPYRRIAFPNNPPPDLEYLDTETLPVAERGAWTAALDRFLRCVSYRTGRPLVVKSPTHTGRIATLAKAFPGAKFIHITRDPRSLFPSTVRLWKSLDEAQALQIPNNEALDGYVIECFQRMYEAFHRDRDQVEPTHLVDVRYEDLIADPVGQLESIYSQLKLGDFDYVRDAIGDWAQTQHREYKTNRHQLPAEQETRILDAWKSYFDRYNYGSTVGAD
ncbi:MAG: sulfotransferase family protein [Planctomycetaceae bacterium]